MTATVEHDTAQPGEAHLTLYAERAVIAKRVVETAIGRVADAVPPVRQEGATTVFSVIEEIVVVERRLMLKRRSTTSITNPAKPRT